MAERFIVFDVETPNSANDRMSAIGITVVENLQVTEELYYLVNPEEPFYSFNVALTGITPEMVADKPHFGKLWGEIGALMNSGILIAHNAPFDMGVLSKCLRAYFPDSREIHNRKYACTCRMAKAAFPQLENHRLNTVSDFLGVSLDHHHAGSDSRACAEILITCLKRGLDLSRFYREYDVSLGKTVGTPLTAKC